MFPVFCTQYKVLNILYAVIFILYAVVCVLYSEYAEESATPRWQTDERRLYLNKTSYADQVEKRRSDCMYTSIINKTCRLHPCNDVDGVSHGSAYASCRRGSTARNLSLAHGQRPYLPSVLAVNQIGSELNPPSRQQRVVDVPECLEPDESTCPLDPPGHAPSPSLAILTISFKSWTPVASRPTLTCRPT